MLDERVQASPPEGYRVARSLEIRFSDTDMMGHVNNVAYVAFLETLRFPAGTTSTWHFVGGHVEVCVTPTAPVLVPSSVCGVKDHVTVTATNNVTYNPVPGSYDLTEGQTLDVTATANAGFA